MSHVFSLVVGDWSGDGHENTESFLVSSTKGYEHLLQAYIDGVAVLGFDLRRECDDYEVNKYSSEFREALILHKITLVEDGVLSGAELHFELYLDIARLGTFEALDIQRIKPDHSISIGGYGLF